MKNNSKFKIKHLKLYRTLYLIPDPLSLSPAKWIETTNAIGIISKAGRYGGTYVQ